MVRILEVKTIDSSGSDVIFFTAIRDGKVEFIQDCKKNTPEIIEMANLLAKTHGEKLEEYYGCVGKIVANK